MKTNENLISLMRLVDVTSFLENKGGTQFLPQVNKIDGNYSIDGAGCYIHKEDCRKAIDNADYFRRMECSVTTYLVPIVGVELINY
jgi:hypothetical protein